MPIKLTTHKFAVVHFFHFIHLFTHTIMKHLLQFKITVCITGRVAEMSTPKTSTPKMSLFYIYIFFLFHLNITNVDIINGFEFSMYSTSCLDFFKIQGNQPSQESGLTSRSLMIQQ